MAISWKDINSYLSLGIDWRVQSQTDGSVKIAPWIYRYDRYSTTNSGGSWSESITEPSGSTGYWSGLSFYNYVDPPESGEFVIDKFNARTYTRKKSAYNITFTLSYSSIGSWYEGSFHSLGSGSKTWQMTVPAKPSYAVSFDANGGANAPSNQTKWYGESLTLTAAQPTRSGYSFVEWNTSADGTGTSYASGATYNQNAALALYAIWRRNTWVVTYLPNEGTGDSFTATKTYGETLELASSGFTRQYYTLEKWNTSANGGGTSYALGADYTTDADIELYAIWKRNVPQAPTSLTASRVSDTSASLAWTRPADADDTWGGVEVQRADDGGEFATLVEVAASAVGYTDTSVTANHSYRYRVRSFNGEGSGKQYSSPITADDTIYNTPAAPSAINAARSDTTHVILYITNPANTATDIEVEHSTDGTTWSSSGQTVTTVGTPVTQANVALSSGGQLYFRVRNIGTHDGTTLNSAWSVSNLVVTIAPPNPPTLNSPASGGVVAYGSPNTSVTFKWQHNPVDGSPQEKADLRYSTNGGSTWTTITDAATTQQQYTLTAALSRNATVTWQVRTKGADASKSGWSASSTFAVYEAPSLSITAPTDPIIGVPVEYSVGYTDNSGSFTGGKLSIIHNGVTEYEEALRAPEGGVIQGSVFAAEFLPQDGETYIFKFEVKSNSTLSASAQATLSVDMQAPHIGTLQITNDPETGYVSLLYGWNEDDGGQPADKVTIFRITKNGRIELASSDTSGASCLDMYAPLNTQYTYLVVTHGTNEAVSQIEFANYLNTGWWFVYWNGKIARAKWNPNGSMTVSRPERTRVHYIGRKDPVSYDGTAVSEETSMEWQVVEREYAQAFLEMVREIGRGIYKSGSGEVFHADFDQASVASDFHKNQPYGSLTLPIVRIDGEQL